MSVPANPATPFYPGLPAFGDLADGVTQYPPFGSPTGAPSIVVGTRNEVGTVQVAGNGITISFINGSPQINGDQIEELTDSPEIERAEQCTCTKRFRMPWYLARDYINYLYRGLVLKDNSGNYFRILSSTIKREKGNLGVLTIVSEALSFDLPPDEFSIEPIELGTGIMKYPRYFSALMPNTNDTETQVNAKQSIIRAIQTYQDSPFFPTSSSLNGLLNGQAQDNIQAQFGANKTVIRLQNKSYDPNITATAEDSWPMQPITAPTYPPAPTQNGDVNPPCILVSLDSATANLGSPDPVIEAAFAAAQEIITKLWKQEDAPYQVAFQLSWSSFYFIKPFYNPGGYVEDPIQDVNAGNPGLPAYFGSPSFDYSVNTIFDAIPIFNPQCYSDDGTPTGNASISWLRKADVVNYERTWFKVTRTWIGTAQAHWDIDLYNQKDRPGTANYPKTNPTQPGVIYGFNTTGQQDF